MTDPTTSRIAYYLHIHTRAQHLCEAAGREVPESDVHFGFEGEEARAVCWACTRLVRVLVGPATTRPRPINELRALPVVRRRREAPLGRTRGGEHDDVTTVREVDREAGR
jgi:hypothetical protein